MTDVERLTRRVEELELRIKAMEISLRRSAEVIPRFNTVAKQLVILLPKLELLINKDKLGEAISITDKMEVN
jgi:hypothetical protein